jgi:cytidine deaminase
VSVVLVFSAAPLGDFCSKAVFVEDFAPCGWCRALVMLLSGCTLRWLLLRRVFVEDVTPCGWCRTLIVLLSGCTLMRLLLGRVFVGDFAPCGWCRALIVLLSGCTLRRLLLGRVAHRGSLGCHCGDCFMRRMSKAGATVLFDTCGRGAKLTLLLFGGFAVLYYTTPPH